MHTQDTHSQNMTKIEANIAKGNPATQGIGSMAAYHAIVAHEAPDAIVAPVVASLQARLQAYVAQGIADTSAKMKSTNKALEAFAMLTAPAQTPAQPAPQVTKSQLNKLRKDDLVALAMQMLNAS